MTIYAGETVIVTHIATNDGALMDDDDVDSVSITIYDSALEEVVEETTMSWNEADDRWEYMWQTEGLDAGSYRVKCTVLAEGDVVINWEFKKLKLARNPV